MNSEANDIVEKFVKITAYNEKLLFWDKYVGDYQKIDYIASDMVLLTIKPNGINELRLYNKWVIDHWRDHFINQRGKKTKPGIYQVYKYYDDLKNVFLKKLNKLQPLDKRVYLNNEISQVDKVIQRHTINNKSLCKKLYELFETYKEKDIYEYQSNKVSPMLELRVIGKLWDLIQYKVFLEAPSTVKLATSEIISSHKLNQKGHKLKFKPLTDSQIIRLHSFLLSNEFIDKSTPKSLIEELINHPGNNLNNKIHWIDVPERNTIRVNKLTLFSLIVNLTAEVFDSKDLYDFIINNIEIKGQSSNLTSYRKSLKSAYYLFHTQQSSKKASDIELFIKNLNKEI
ncbi:MAG: hypothetical protein V4553_16115 [Bacteroidota bacterium]